MLVEGLQTLLSADATMQTLLGTPATRSDETTGLFPSIAMASSDLTMPYIVYQQISGEGDVVSMQGTNALQVARWRFSCYGNTYKQAKVLAKTLKLLLISVNGALPGAATKTQLQGSWFRLEADDIEPIPHGTIFATHLDFEFRFVDYDT